VAVEECRYETVRFPLWHLSVSIAAPSYRDVTVLQLSLPQVPVVPENSFFPNLL
jgi:hypothetical protein